MGSCASKPKYVDYDPQMKQRKEGNEENEVKQEDDGRSSPVRRSSSRPSLGILFQKEKDEQGELLTEQDEKQKIPDPSANVLVSDKLENSRAHAIQTVVVEDQVKPTASLVYAKQVPEEPLNHETLPASLDSSTTNKAQDVGTNPDKLNDQVKPTASLVYAKEVPEEPLNHETFPASLDSSTTNKAQYVGTNLDKLNDQVKPTASLVYAKQVPEEPLNHKTLPASLDSSTTNKAQDVGTNPDKLNDQVKPTASLVYAKEVPEEPLNHETLPASLDSSTTNKAQDVGTNQDKLNDQGLPTATQAPQSVQVGDADHVENITGVEGHKTDHDSENQLTTVDPATERGHSSSLRNNNLEEDAKNSLKPGSELPVVDSEDTSDNVEDNNLGTQISTGHLDKIEKSQDSEVRTNVEDEVLGATSPANETHVLNTAVENTSQVETEALPAVGDHVSNTVKDKTFVAIDRNYVAEDESGNSLKSETLISNDVNDTSGEVEDKEARDTKLTIEHHDAENFQKSGSESPVVDNISSSRDVADNKVGATQQGTIDNDRGNDAENSLKLEKEVPNVDLKHRSNNAQDADLDVTMPIKGSEQEAWSRTEHTDVVPVEDHHSNTNTLETIGDGHSNSLTVNREKQISESIEASGNELDAIKPIDGLKEYSGKADNTDLVPVEYHHDNAVSTTEEQFLESKKASVAENVDSVVPTSTHVSSVVEESVPSGKKPGERLVTETVEKGGLHRQVEEVAVNSQSDHLVIKAEAETIDVDKNANKDIVSSEKTIHSSSQVHQEELTQNKHLQNSEASSTDFSKELAENDKVPNVENVEGAAVNNTNHVKDKL